MVVVAVFFLDGRQSRPDPSHVRGVVSLRRRYDGHRAVAVAVLVVEQARVLLLVVGRVVVALIILPRGERCKCGSVRADGAGMGLADRPRLHWGRLSS